MKQKLMVGFSLLLLLTVLILIFRDLFTGVTTTPGNPCDYNLEKLKSIDTSLIGFKEIRTYKPSLSRCNGIAVDSASTIFIAGDKEVQIIDNSFHKIRSFPVDSIPHCIAVGNHQEIYLGMGNHVEESDIKGLKLKKWLALNSKGYITAMAVSGPYIYVADAVNRVVLKYNHDGHLVAQIGKKDKSRGIDSFVIPSMYFDVAIGPDNDLWIVNPGKHKIENFSADGELISSWGTTSIQLEGFAGCCNPVHFAVLPDGNFVTYEKGLDRIKLYDPTGKFVCVVAGPNKINGNINYNCSFGAAVNDIAVNPQGFVYVLDAQSNTVRIFGKKQK
jgi:hypothetical protein